MGRHPRRDVSDFESADRFGRNDNAYESGLRVHFDVLGRGRLFATYYCVEEGNLLSAEIFNHTFEVVLLILGFDEEILFVFHQDFKFVMT